MTTAVGVRDRRAARGRALSRPARATLRGGHVVLGVAWTGMALVMLVLPAALLLGGAGAQTVFVLGVMDVVGGTMIPFVAVGTVLTGVALGLGTPWGLVRHRWVVAKTVLSLLVIVTSVALSTRLLAAAQDAGGQDPALLWWLAGVAASHQLMLVTATLLSVQKPGGRIRSLTGNQKVA
ncbi:hypothetical protein [Pseudonocardia sp. KRD291]|uniref:hypothetical protein n=1 Tax=Pseudonocardia sp. KRD291 TaxID=2792007 RepID=UPI001C49DB7E|nr:hypothetical protein [Pseudonocardia sp. KRD291]MBW0106528.1 hypothetical protein [Pseudonocardia sp. KRD291]